MLRLKTYVLLIFLGIGAWVNAQTTRKYSNEFMNIGVDAAALGMSNAVVSHTADVNSGYWNPAGLVNLEDNQLALMHSSYFANIANYNYLAFAKPLDDRSTVGISLIDLGWMTFWTPRSLLTNKATSITIVLVYFQLPIMD